MAEGRYYPNCDEWVVIEGEMQNRCPKYNFETFFARVIISLENKEFVRKDFIEDIITTINLADRKDIYKGVYIYGITVIEPVVVREPFSIPGASEDDLAQAEYGYLHHKLLYSLNEDILSKVLAKMLDSGDLVKIDINFADEFRLYKNVRIR